MQCFHGRLGEDRPHSLHERSGRKLFCNLRYGVDLLDSEISLEERTQEAQEIVSNYQVCSLLEIVCAACSIIKSRRPLST